MTKYTLGVYKAYKNSGNLRFHKKGTKKSWKHYFIEVDDYDGGIWTSGKHDWIFKRLLSFVHSVEYG